MNINLVPSSAVFNWPSPPLAGLVQGGSARAEPDTLSRTSVTTIGHPSAIVTLCHTELNKYLYYWSRRETTRVPAVLVTTAKAMYEYDPPSNLALPMSQPPSHIPTPLATAVWDWAAVPDSAIWSDSNDNEVIAKGKYDERQHWRRAQKEQKAAEEATAWERVESEHQEREAAGLHRWEEAEHWEQEEIECQEKAEGNHWELAEHQEREAQAHQEQESMRRHEAQMDSLVRSARHQQRVPRAKGGCQLSTCPVLGTKKSQKHVMPEETVGTKTKGLYAIAEAIDWHTEEMVQLQQMVKLLSSSHHHVIKSMVELLQETTYPVPQALEVPAELSSEESAIETPGNTNAKGEMEEEVEGEGLEEESQ
ncbi:hypothetical protein EV401DRAFT_1892288 [Pisolithus croceorrhizus]|nr:hypothetical protein EV401DRAFT_1892288 [Pisolithus croceorrhizus]